MSELRKAWPWLAASLFVLVVWFGKTPIWRKLMYRRLAKARSSDFVERVLMKARRR